MSDTKIKRGDIAKCSLGGLGLVTSDSPEEITYADGNVGVAWKGVFLLDHAIETENGEPRIIKAGSPWSSRNPQLVVDSDVLAKIMRGL